MTKAGLIILFILSVFTGYSQSITFNVANPFWLYPLMGRVVELNNNYYCIGTYYDGNSRILLIKYDSNGNILQTKDYGDTVSSYTITDILINNESNFLVTLYYWQYDIFDQYSAPIVLVIDTNFSILKEKIYPLMFEGFSFTPVIINNSIYMTGGTAYDSNWDTLPITPHGGPDYNFLFWKMDTSFNDLIYKSVGTEWMDAPYKILESFDTTLLLAGWSDGFPPYSVTGSDRRDWYLIDIDTTGQVLNEFHFGNPTLFDVDGIMGMSTDSDSNYYIAGQQGSYYNQQGKICTDIHVIKLNSSFQIVWEKNFGLSKPGQTVSDITSTSDNMQVVLTQHYVDNYLTDNLYSKTIKFNSEGKVLWIRKYFQGDTTEYVRARAWDIDETIDKGFILCGSIYDTTHLYPPMQAWLVKTDSLGCDGLRSCNDTAMVVEILSYPDTLCKNDTNLIAVRFKGRSAPYSLFANATLAIDSIYYPYTLPLWIDTLMPFVPQDTGWQQLVVALHEPWERRAYDTVQVYVKNCTTLIANHDYYKNMVEIFPNPATTVLHINFKTALTLPATITVYDTQGKAVKQLTTSVLENITNISELPEGVYKIMVVGDKFIRYEKIVKLR